MGLAAAAIQTSTSVDGLATITNPNSDPDQDSIAESLSKQRYTGTIQRFFQSEVVPVHFGVKNDAALLLKAAAVALVLANVFSILVYMQDDHEHRHHIPPLPAAERSRLLRILIGFEHAAGSYYSNDGSVVVGTLLCLWFMGYNVISAAIWWQFERHESRIPDEYEIVGFVGRTRAGTGTATATTTPTAMPNAPHSSSTGRILYQQQNIHSAAIPSEKPSSSGQPANPYDKSYVVVSLPDGEFSVAKKQKPAIVPGSSV